MVDCGLILGCRAAGRDPTATGHSLEPSRPVWPPHAAVAAESWNVLVQAETCWVQKCPQDLEARVGEKNVRKRVRDLDHRPQMLRRRADFTCLCLFLLMWLLESSSLPLRLSWGVSAFLRDSGDPALPPSACRGHSQRTHRPLAGAQPVGPAEELCALRTPGGQKPCQVPSAGV